MTTKKADIYLSENDNEIRISVDITNEKSIEEMLSKIAYTINEHKFSETSIRSIYFSEEMTIDKSYEKYNPLGIRETMEGTK
jgi:hypothetical protein